MTLRAKKHRLPGITCPHCNSPATQRFARTLSALVRDVTYRCENDDCGHGFVAQIGIIRTTIPSASPNPEIFLPFAPQSRSPKPANDDAPAELPAPANDVIGAMTG
jgi:hypothetical protein